MQKLILVFYLACLSCLTCCSSTYSNERETPLSLSQRNSTNLSTTNTIDYKGFRQLTQTLDPYRQKRLIAIGDFVQMMEEENTMVLDTRSRAAYDDIHLKGAVHLNFSDFTADKLAKVIPTKKTRILIYCNNNFLDGGISLASKSAPLALNIPTFINLVGYGYEDIYELKDILTIDQAGEFLKFEGNDIILQQPDKIRPLNN
jgi:hypothetical protein